MGAVCSTFAPCRVFLTLVNVAVTPTCLVGEACLVGLTGSHVHNRIQTTLGDVSVIFWCVCRCLRKGVHFGGRG